jgi:hypothetical protein
MKLCTKCGTNPRQVDSNKSRACYCKQCWSDRSNEWNKKNRDHIRDKKFRQKFGITLADYHRMSAAQGHACAICKTPQSDGGRFFAVDHNHETGKVRGLLCGSCNCAIGLLKDSPLVLHSAIEYLNKHR